MTTEIKTNTQQPRDSSKLDNPLPVNKMMQEASEALVTEPVVFPNEIWVEIFKHLPTAKDLCRVAQVSWHFYRLANDASLWRDTSPIWAPFNTLTENTVDNQYWLRDTFFQSSHRVREKIINTRGFNFMLWEVLYQPYLMRGHPTIGNKMTLFFKARKQIIDISKVKVTRSFSEDNLTSLIDEMKKAYQKVKNQDPDAMSLVDGSYRKNGRIKVSCWDEELAHFAKFIIRHPHLGPRLTRKHLGGLLTVTAHSQSVARTMVETVFLHEIQLPALQTPVDESFFKLVAASLTRNDYKHLLWIKDNPSVPIAYVRRQFKEKCLIQNKLIDGRYPLQDLIALAKEDGRVALLLFAVPELTQVVPINTLFDLALQDLQAGERHWARASFDRWNSDHYLQKCSKDSPIITLYFSYLAWALVFSASTQARFFNQLHKMHSNKTYVPPDTWKDGFPLALTQFEWVDGNQDLVPFELPLCQPDYNDLHRQWQLFLAHRRTLQAPLSNQFPSSAGNPSSSLNTQLPTVKAVTQPKTVSPDELPMARLKVSTPPVTLDESSQQGVSDNIVHLVSSSIVSERRANAPDTDLNIDSHTVSSTSWGSILAWVLSGVLTTVGIGLLVMSTILSATYMMPLMVGGFISLASGLVLGLKLLARPKSVYEVRTSVDNYNAKSPTLDTESGLHQEAIVYEALNLSEVSRHEQLPVKHSMQHAQYLSASTVKTSVMGHLV